MRILWYSNAPWATTGYGQQTAIWVPKFQAAGYDTAVAAFHGLQGTPMNWGGMTVFPGSQEDQWAQDLMLGHYSRHGADLMITLMDAWVLDPGHLRNLTDAGMRIVHWQPVDCEPLSVLDYRVLSEAGTRTIAISRHGARMMEQFDPLYVPHGINTNVFAPTPADAVAAARQRGGFTDSFLIGVNAANQDPVRKGFGEQLSAFRLFADRHPEARMLIHSRKVSKTGNNLERIIEILKLQGLVQFSDQYLTVSGMTSVAELAKWYGVLDLFSNCSYGEGFGIPIVEAQACGTPVVVTDGSAMTELAGPGWAVDGEFYWNAGHSAWWTRPSVQNILAAYEQAFQEWRTPEAAQRRLEARAFALQYDVENVMSQYWQTVLDELEGVTGTVRSGGLRWYPDDTVRDEVAERALLDLLPEGGVLVDANAGPGFYALRAAVKASRVIASGSGRLRDNAAVNKLTNVVVQDELDLGPEPFIDVVKLDPGDLEAMRDTIKLHHPKLVIPHGKGIHGLRSELTGLGYSTRLVPGTNVLVAS